MREGWNESGRGTIRVGKLKIGAVKPWYVGSLFDLMLCLGWAVKTLWSVIRFVSCKICCKIEENMRFFVDLRCAAIGSV